MIANWFSPRSSRWLVETTWKIPRSQPATSLWVCIEWTGRYRPAIFHIRPTVFHWAEQRNVHSSHWDLSLALPGRERRRDRGDKTKAGGRFFHMGPICLGNRLILWWVLIINRLLGGWLGRKRGGTNTTTDWQTITFFEKLLLLLLPITSDVRKRKKRQPTTG